MTTSSILALAFAIGMGHALESDHLAAMSTLLRQSGSRRAALKRGAVWGLGHTLSLFVLSSAVLLLGFTISDRVQAGLEFAVGLMILLLGLNTLRVMRRDRIHAHVHDHGGARHIHLHSHRDDAAEHRQSAHDHDHRRSNLQAMFVGLMHGAAGSGALLLLTVGASGSIGQALAYLTVFGLGSMAGMAVVSVLLSVPLALAQNGANWMRQGTTLAVGLGAIVIGLRIVLVNGPALL